MSGVSGVSVSVFLNKTSATIFATHILFALNEIPSNSGFGFS